MPVLTKDECSRILDELTNCQRPLFLFHDDPDGLASFLILYRWKQEGRGLPVKAVPRITTQFLQKIIDYDADKVFVLDVAVVEQDFLDQAKVPVVWIDHHPLLEREKVLYFNSRKHDNLNVPTPHLCFDVVKQDLWLAVVGCVGDWHLPSELLEGFREEFSDLLPENINTPEQALFDSKTGLLAKVLSFNLKGKMQDVMKSIKVLTRINSPYEILNQETPRGRLIFKKFEEINAKYEELLGRAIKKKSDDPIFVFTYSDDELSLTKDVANELLYRFPDKIIILGRERSGEVRCSLRSAKQDIQKILESALIGVQGHGGGHEHACGASIKKEDFEQFVKNIRKEIEK
ncbi:DHH family phosphoesterase [Candidatus Woesearchaeota archaeon]|nr:DHH family phosphoesterase [Candidatus Woesearchaeota archaeon]